MNRLTIFVLAAVLLLGLTSVGVVASDTSPPEAEASGCFGVTLDSETAVDDGGPPGDAPPDHAKNPNCTPPPDPPPANPSADRPAPR